MKDRPSLHDFICTHLKFKNFGTVLEKNCHCVRTAKAVLPVMQLDIYVRAMWAEAAAKAQDYSAG